MGEWVGEYGDYFLLRRGMGSTGFKYDEAISCLFDFKQHKKMFIFSGYLWYS